MIHVAGASASCSVVEARTQRPERPAAVCVIQLLLSKLAADLPGFSSNQRGKIARTVHHAKNEQCVFLQKINDAIGAEEDFTKVFAVELGNDTADARITEKCFRGFDETINEGDGVEDGVAGDKVFDVLKIVPGRQRPADLRHRAILSFSSAWVRVRPSATS